ncbi:MAG: hypothetical protein V1777_02935 [Candidatus Micrarchaeota archaeon]
MQSKQAILISLLMVLVLSAAQSKTIAEQTFSELGFAQFQNEAALTTACNDFALISNANQIQPGFYSVLSLHVQALPLASDDSSIDVFLNDNQTVLETAKATDFKNGWWRLYLPNEKLQQSNAVRVCLNTSATTTKLVLLSDSLYGVYQLPEFKSGDFVKIVSNTNPLVGQEFDSTVTLHNSGSEGVDVNVLYKKPDVEFRYLAFVRGQSGFFGRIEPDQTISFAYTTKATQQIPATLPAAVLFYTNEWGETVQLVSNYPVMRVENPLSQIDAIVLNKSNQKQFVENQSIPFQIAVTNTGITDVSNISIVLDSSQILNEWTGQPSEFNVEILKAGETKYLDFSVTPNRNGNFQIGCLTRYLSVPIVQTSCQSAELTVEPKPFPIEFIAGIVLAVLAVLIFLFYQYRK